MTASRTKRTIQNSKVSLILFLIQVFVGFFSRKIFLDYLGDEVIGLNTTLGNILSFLNLAELGIGIAMATSLYKPIHDEDHETIIEIITVQGILYRRIALILCGLSIPVLIALPFIFPSVKCGIIYVFIAYTVFLSGSIFSYLWNYRQVLIQADQKSFKLDPWITAVRFIKTCLQISILIFTSLGIWGWIGAEFIGNIVNVFIINYVLKKEYPWLQKSKEPVKQLLGKYHSLLIKTKQLFVHKIAGYVLNQTSPLVIYACVSLEMVTYYGNYMVLIGYCSYITIGPFISLWIRSKYILSESTLLLLLLSLFIRLSRTVIESFKDAYQLFGDVWAPIIESCLNLGGSILFGYLWGLNGVLMGVNLSLIIIVLLWKPYYTFRYGIKSPVMSYFMQYAIHLIILIGGAIITKYIMALIMFDKNNIITLATNIIIGLLLYIIITYTILMFFTKGMRMFTIRLKNILKRKI